MNRETATAINRRLLKHLQDGSTDLCSDQGAVAAEAFTCPDTHALERERLFLQTPQPVAFSAELNGSNTYLTLDVMELPVLLTRDEHGALHAFINACAHRGMPVATGSGTANSLVCGFHGWSYRPDGALRGRPEEHCFDGSKDALGLRELSVAERCGVIVLGLSGSVSQGDVESHLDPLVAELESYGLASYRFLGSKAFEVDANWKLVTDLSLESYHFRTLHRDSVAELLAAGAAVDTFGQHSRWAFPLKTISRLQDVPESDWPASIEGSVTYTLYPGVMLLFNSLGAQMIRAEPANTPGCSRVSYRGVFRPDAREEDARAAYVFGGEVFANEDLPAAEASFRGIHGRGGSLPLGRNEPLLQFWHELWRQAVAS